MLQIHWNVPGKLVHVANGEQLSVPSAHSSTSVRKRKKLLLSIISCDVENNTLIKRNHCSNDFLGFHFEIEIKL